ncbi:MAG: SGNH/GDSL hydrolase family protein [Terriglobus roseus]|nr:SGNH/GDSL hydrolase family protein [Terriglobus roseus]
MALSWFVLASFVSVVLGGNTHRSAPHGASQGGYGGFPYGGDGGKRAWTHLDIRSLVTFGDSYTDESRLSYFIGHAGSPPPPGTILPVVRVSALALTETSRTHSRASTDSAQSNNTASGGYIWDRYAAWYLSEQQHRSVDLYDYAVAGAVCSNEITPRYFAPINAPFPDVEGYEIPAFYADYDTGVLKINPSSTAYAMWIGTNDLGAGAFLTDSQVAGKSVADYLDCVYRAVDKLYASPINARYFVLMNIAPLQLVPMYQLPGVSNFELDYQNATATHYRMLEQVLLVNEAYEFRTQVYSQLSQRWPGMHVALYNVHDLLSDIYDDPAKYLNGTAPATSTGYVNHCNEDKTVCVRADSPDSYEWYDELHPSEQTDRIIANEFVNVVKGNSKYATYFS